MRVKSGSALAGIALLVAAAPAPAAVTIGQLDPAPAMATCGNDQDGVQVNVDSGTSYRAPGAGTITSWSTNALAAAGQMLGMKMYDRIADPDVYKVAGHSGPFPLSASGGLHTFAANIPVQVGDQLGITIPLAGGNPDCVFSGATADSIRYRAGNLSDGLTGNFNLVDSGLRLNVTATFVPSNVFTVGKTSRNRKKGTATVEVTVPNPGELTALGNGVTATGATGASSAIAVGAAGAVKLTIRAKGKKRKKLNTKGKVKAALALTYTPTSGTASTQSLSVKLRKKR